MSHRERTLLIILRGSDRRKSAHVDTTQVATATWLISFSMKRSVISCNEMEIDDVGHGTVVFSQQA